MMNYNWKIIFDNYFWKEERDLPQGSGFELFGSEHLAVLAGVLVFLVICILIFRKMKPDIQVIILRVIAILLPVFELLKIGMLVASHRMDKGHLPLHLCSMAIYIYPIISFMNRNKIRDFLTEISVITLLPASIGALAFPDWTMYPMLNFYSIHAFIWHFLQVLFPAFCLINKWAVPDIRNIWKNSIFLLIGAIIIGTFDFIMHCNYWFLMRPVPDTPLEWLYNEAGSRWYIVSLFFMATAVNLFVYFFYYLFARGKEKRIRIILILIFLASLGILAYYATTNHWFERGTIVDGSDSGSSSGFPEVIFSDDEESESNVAAFPRDVPEYSGQDTVVISDNKPNFTKYDIEHISGEMYSDLDSLGRCGTAVAMIDHSMMPDEPRGEIGDIRPSGWNQEKYPGLVNSEPPYLYNRCHLIAYMLTGQNANEKNLITGTRYFNSELMLPYENQVAQYLYDNDISDFSGSYKHVLYRVTPYFKGDELVARGVELEACSVEDEGKSLSLHVFIYNVQPGIEIDYLTGESRVSE